MGKVIQDSVGYRIRVLREIRGMSQSELSRKVNVTPQAIQSLEADSSPKRKTRNLVSIANALDFDPQYLDLATTRDQFRERVSAVVNKVPDSDPEENMVSGTNDDQLVDVAIEQAKRNIALRLSLSNETISGRDYLKLLSEELLHLTTKQGS